jgi:hypothetical protein
LDRFRQRLFARANAYQFANALARPLGYIRTAPMLIHRPPGKVGRMEMWLADPPFFHGYRQGTRQLVELLSAFGLTALILIISKYGFGDVLNAGTIVLDPSRVAAQIVSGIGFLGAGLIITRRGAVHGLTTAAAIWECAAIAWPPAQACCCSP